MVLEHVPNSSARKQEPSGRQSVDSQDTQVPVEQRDRYLEPHPKGVDRARALEQQRPTRREAVAAEQPPHPFAAGCRDVHVQHEAARPGQEDPPHRATLPRAADIGSRVIGGAGRIRTRDTRVKSPLL